MMDNSKTGDWYYTVGKDVWESVPEFNYEPPTFASILGNNRSNLLTLSGWVMLSSIGLFAASRRLNI